MKNPTLAKYVKPAIITLICLILIIAATFTGCQLSSIADGDKTPNTPETEGETDTNEDVENEKNDPVLPQPTPVVLYNVLTGLKTTSDLADLRPVAICIENTPYSMPQYGISSAEVLIEVPLADGTTRLMMLTTNYNQVTTIGAVSSTRPYLLELGAAFGAIQAFKGSDGTVSDETLALYSILDSTNKKLAGIFYTDPTRFSEMDLMTNGILLDSGIRRNELSPTLDGTISIPYQFTDEGTSVVPNDGEATNINIQYSQDLNVNYMYDSKSGTYLRSQFGTAQLDGNNGKQVSFDNLFILHTSSVTYEKEDSTSLDLIIEDGGSGYYISGGAYEAITWQQTEDGSITFFDKDGAKLEVNRGTSYIGIVAAGAMESVTIK